MRRGKLDLRHVPGDDAIRADALVVGTEQLEAPVVDALDFVAISEEGHPGDAPFQPRQNHVAKRRLQEVAVERVSLLRVGAAEWRREAGHAAPGHGFPVRGEPVAKRLKPLDGGGDRMRAMR